MLITICMEVECINLWDDKAEQVKSKIVCDDKIRSYYNDEARKLNPTSKKPMTTLPARSSGSANLRQSERRSPHHLTTSVKQYMKDLLSILRDAPGSIRLEVSGEDLLAFSNNLIDRAKEELAAQVAEARKERYLTKEQVPVKYGSCSMAWQSCIVYRFRPSVREISEKYEGLE